MQTSKHRKRIHKECNELRASWKSKEREGRTQSVCGDTVLRQVGYNSKAKESRERCDVSLGEDMAKYGQRSKLNKQSKQEAKERERERGSRLGSPARLRKKERR